MNNPKILLFDIETAPNLAYVWGKYEQDVIRYYDEWYMLCFAAKWLDKSKIITSKLNDFKLFKKDKQNDLEICKVLWKLLDEADVVITHNGDEFDVKKTNARFIYHGLPPPSLYQTIDTKKIAKKYFKFNSNSLDDLGKHLNLGEKLKHEGFSLWLKCMSGDRNAWNKMIKYNKQDVVLLEKVYLRFLGWMNNHPNYGVYRQQTQVCPNCGSNDLMKNGLRATKTQLYQRWRCNNCFTNCQSIRAEKINKPGIKN